MQASFSLNYAPQNAEVHKEKKNMKIASVTTLTEM